MFQVINKTHTYSLSKSGCPGLQYGMEASSPRWIATWSVGKCGMWREKKVTWLTTIIGIHNINTRYVHQLKPRSTVCHTDLTQGGFWRMLHTVLRPSNLAPTNMTAQNRLLRHWNGMKWQVAFQVYWFPFFLVSCQEICGLTMTWFGEWLLGCWPTGHGMRSVIPNLGLLSHRDGKENGAQVWFLHTFCIDKALFCLSSVLHGPCSHHPRLPVSQRLDHGWDRILGSWIYHEGIAHENTIKYHQ